MRYDGETPDRDRPGILERFCDATDRHHDVLVANTRSIAHGVTLLIAEVMIYYSRDFSLEKNLQSEDRGHRIGQTKPVLIVDLAAWDSVDMKIRHALRTHRNVATEIQGDEYRDWIRANPAGSYKSGRAHPTYGE